MDSRDRFRRCLLGLAVGTPSHHCGILASGSFAPLTDMVGGGLVPAGTRQWTDDTSMALLPGDQPDRETGLHPSTR